MKKFEKILSDFLLKQKADIRRKEGKELKREHIIVPCRGMSFELKTGQTIAIIDLKGGQVADLFAENANDPNEFTSPGVTIDCNESLNLRIGDHIYSNLYRPMLKVIYDDVGVHDLLHPCCRIEMYEFFYRNVKGHPNCLDNINAVLNEKRPIIQPVNLFMNTKIFPDGKIEVRPPISRAGDKIVLMTEANLRLGIAACSVSESFCNGGECTPLKIVIQDDESDFTAL